MISLLQATSTHYVSISLKGYREIATINANGCFWHVDGLQYPCNAEISKSKLKELLIHYANTGNLQQDLIPYPASGKVNLHD